MATIRIVLECVTAQKKRDAKDVIPYSKTRINAQNCSAKKHTELAREP